MQRPQAATQRLSPRTGSRLVMTDFDAVRSSLRGGITILTAVGGTAAIGGLLRTSLRGERLTVNADGIQQFITSLSAEQWKRLVICLSLDLIGAMPELLVAPPLGDTVDALWAPVYAFCLFQLFGDRSFLYKTTLAAAGFLEEALPFVSLIPSATIGWLIQHNAEQVTLRIERSMSGGEKDGKGDAAQRKEPAVGKDAPR